METVDENTHFLIVFPHFPSKKEDAKSQFSEHFKNQI